CPDSRWFAVGFPAGTINIYDLTSEKKEFIGLPQGPVPVTISFHPDGQKLAMTANNSVQVWDLSAGKVIQTFTLPGSVHGTAWHPEGKLLAASCAKNFAIHIWNAVTGQEQVVLKGHSAEMGFAFSHAGDVLVSNS